jgi:DNA-binding response OmpR family regulator
MTIEVLMGHRPRILVCEHDVALGDYLVRTLEEAGFWVDSVQTTRQALKRLAERHYQALTLNLLLQDQDALSFSQELRVLGMLLPILVISDRIRPKAPVRLTQDTDMSASTDEAHPEPDWVRKAADQARFIFAVKSACQRSRGFHPRILHVEADRFSAGLVKAALRDSAELVQAGDADDLDEALEMNGYDFALINPDTLDIGAADVLHRIVALHPETPVIMHTRSGTQADPRYGHTDDADPGDADMVTALRTLLLHTMRMPLRAQA